MSKFTNYIIEEAKTWAAQYETDFRRTTLKEYLKNNNLTKRAYIKIVKEEITANKQEIKNCMRRMPIERHRNDLEKTTKKNSLLVVSQQEWNIQGLILKKRNIAYLKIKL